MNPSSRAVSATPAASSRWLCALLPALVLGACVEPATRGPEPVYGGAGTTTIYGPYPSPYYDPYYLEYYRYYGYPPPYGYGPPPPVYYGPPVYYYPPPRPPHHDDDDGHHGGGTPKPVKPKPPAIVTPPRDAHGSGNPARGQPQPPPARMQSKPAASEPANAAPKGSSTKPASRDTPQP